MKKTIFYQLKERFFNDVKFARVEKLNGALLQLHVPYTVHNLYIYIHIDAHKIYTSIYLSVVSTMNTSMQSVFVSIPSYLCGMCVGRCT